MMLAASPPMSPKRADVLRSEATVSRVASKENPGYGSGGRLLLDRRQVARPGRLRFEQV
jgi:hypothetical protein